MKIFFPPEGNFDIDAGDGGGGGDHLGPLESPKITQKYFVRKLITLLGQFSKNVENTFKMYSYIQKKTTNPI